MHGIFNLKFPPKVHPPEVHACANSHLLFLDNQPTVCLVAMCIMYEARHHEGKGCCHTILIISSFRKGPSELARPSGSNCPSEDESGSGSGPSSFLSREGEKEGEGSWRRQGKQRCSSASDFKKVVVAERTAEGTNVLLASNPGGYNPVSLKPRWVQPC